MFWRARGLALGACALALALGGCSDPRYCDAGKPCTDPLYPVCDEVKHECVAAAPWDGGVDAAVDAGRDVGPVVDGKADGEQEDAMPVPDGGCEAPLRECGGYCYPLDDVNHCGPGCERCQAPENGHATCDGVSCGWACDVGYWANGNACVACDTVEHCGAGCEACYAPGHGVAMCVEGKSCDFECEVGYLKSASECVACETAAHCGPGCVACVGMHPVCEGGVTGKCVCTSSSCSGTTPVCDGVTKVCRGCVEHEECGSGACDLETGACVGEGEVVYVDKGNASCTNTGAGAGSRATPYCGFAEGVSGAMGVGKKWVVVGPGAYALGGTVVVQDKEVRVVGAGAGVTEVAMTPSGVPVITVGQTSGTAMLMLDGVRVSGGKGAAGHGVMCGALGGQARLWVRKGEVSGNGGIGVSASGCSVVVERSVVSGNGGIGVSASGCSVVVERSVVRGNQGGGMSLASSDFEVENCLVVENGKPQSGTPCTTGSQVGGVVISGNGTVAADRFVNNTVAANMACNGVNPGVMCVGATVVDIRNSIVWGNQTFGGDGQLGGSGCGVTASWVEGMGGATDPKFVGGSPYDYHLQGSSPCINGGTAVGAPSVDLDGKARVGNPDIGCYEGQ